MRQDMQIGDKVKYLDFGAIYGDRGWCNHWVVSSSYRIVNHTGGIDLWKVDDSSYTLIRTERSLEKLLEGIPMEERSPPIMIPSIPEGYKSRVREALADYMWLTRPNRPADEPEKIDEIVTARTKLALLLDVPMNGVWYDFYKFRTKEKDNG